MKIKRSSIICFTPPNGWNSWGWVNGEPGARSFLWVFHMGPKHLDEICWFLRFISKERIGMKQLDLKPIPYGMSALQLQLNPATTCSSKPQSSSPQFVMQIQYSPICKLSFVTIGEPLTFLIGIGDVGTKVTQVIQSVSNKPTLFLDPRGCVHTITLQFGYLLAVLTV